MHASPSLPCLTRLRGRSPFGEAKAGNPCFSKVSCEDGWIRGSSPRMTEYLTGIAAMTKQIRLNAFAMNCVAHESPGLWTHPRDRTAEYNRLPYWTDLARTLERGRFDGLFL